MTDQDRAERRPDAWLSAEQMAALCGVSVATVKRRCEDGKPIRCRDGTLVEVQSERIARPQGWEWRIRAMTAPPRLSAPLTQPNQEKSTPLASDALPFNERALNILDMLLTTSLDNERERADEVARLREQVARYEERAIAADRRADAAERSLSAAQEAHADCSNLSHAEAARIFEEAREMRAERDALAADLAEATRRAEGAERRPWWKRRWW